MRHGLALTFCRCLLTRLRQMRVTVIEKSKLPAGEELSVGGAYIDLPDLLLTTSVNGGGNRCDGASAN